MFTKDFSTILVIYFFSWGGISKRKEKRLFAKSKNIYLKEEWFLVAMVTSHVFLLMVLPGGFVVTIVSSGHNFILTHTVGP